MWYTKVKFPLIFFWSNSYKIAYRRMLLPVSDMYSELCQAYPSLQPLLQQKALS